MRLLYFRADGCGVCHLKAPVAEGIARSLGLDLEVLDLGEKEGRGEAQRRRIHTVPTLALIDGERVRFRLIGRMITPENAAHLAALTEHPRQEG